MATKIIIEGYPTNTTTGLYEALKAMALHKVDGDLYELGITDNPFDVNIIIPCTERDVLEWDNIPHDNNSLLNYREYNLLSKMLSDVNYTLS